MSSSTGKNWHLVKRFVLLTLVAALVIVAIPSLFHHPTQTLAQTTNPQTTKTTNVVIDWNQTAIKVTQAASAPSTEQYRALAITHAAIFDAVNAIDHRYTTYAVDLKAPTGASLEAAVAAAGHGVLTHLYPAQQADIDKALAATLEKLPEGQAKVDGINVGKQVAEKLVALRSQDGSDAKVDYQPGTGIGVWQPTPPTFAPALAPHWGKVKPFTFTSLSQFKILDPPAVNSAAYIKDLNEVKSIGAKNSAVRTADQTAAAIFWTISTPVLWNEVARAAATAKGNTITDNARLFALLNMAGSDGYVAGYAVKYKYKLWRPVTAIRNADAIGNSALSADPNWEPLLITPAHPDYISGHCVSSDAPKRVLQRFFGNDTVKVSVTHPPNVGVTRSYTSFSQIAKEVGNARVWGGIHTRTADIQGGALGTQIGDYAFEHFLRPIKA